MALDSDCLLIQLMYLLLVVFLHLSESLWGKDSHAI